MIKSVAFVVGVFLFIAFLIVCMALAVNLGNKIIFNKDCTVSAETIKPFVVKQYLLNVHSAGDATEIIVNDHWFWAGTHNFVDRDVKVNCK